MIICKDCYFTAAYLTVWLALYICQVQYLFQAGSASVQKS